LNKTKDPEPVLLLNEIYQQFTSVPDRHLLQLEIDGALRVHEVQGGAEKELAVGESFDLFFLLAGTVSYSTGNRDGQLDLRAGVPGPLYISEEVSVRFSAETDSLVCTADSNRLD
jgi:hypothetical protein